MCVYTRVCSSYSNYTRVHAGSHVLADVKKNSGVGSRGDSVEGVEIKQSARGAPLLSFFTLAGRVGGTISTAGHVEGTLPPLDDALFACFSRLPSSSSTYLYRYRYYILITDPIRDE